MIHLDWGAISNGFVAVVAAAASIGAARTSRTDRRRADKHRQEDFKRQEDRDKAREERSLAEALRQEDRDAQRIYMHENNSELQLIAPHDYPIKKVEGCWVNPSGNDVSFGRGGDDPVTDGTVTIWTFRPTDPCPNTFRPAFRFVNWNDHRYYHYRGYTWRFGQNAEWDVAIQKFTAWIGRGPKPDA